MIDKRLQIVRTAIAVIDVIGVFPDVTAEDGGGAMHQRTFAIGCLGDFELAVLHRQPAPAGAELADAGGGEIGLEFLESTEVLGDLLFQTAWQFGTAAIGLHPAPELQMIVVLAGIVEDRGILPERTLDDLLERFALEFGPLDRVVSVGHVSLVMLIVWFFRGFFHNWGAMGLWEVGVMGMCKVMGRCSNGMVTMVYMRPCSSLL